MLKYGVGKCFPGVQSFVMNFLASAVKYIFATSNTGAWYDPSDMSTLYQDSAGTTPVTAMEQPVGLMRDKSGSNNHAVQPTAINRPVLSARVNLLTKTEQLTDAAWTIQAGAVVTQISGAEWEIDLTACLAGYGVFTVGGNIAANSTYTIAADIKTVIFNGTNQLVIEDPVGGAGGGGKVVVLTNAFIRNTLNGTNISSSARGVWFKKVDSGAMVIRVKFPQLEVGVTATRYQRVNTATDYDAVGFPKYLAFNGVNSGMSVPNIDFSVTNKLTLVAGLRKLVDTPDAIFLESSAGASYPADTGSFYVTAPEGAGGTYRVLAHGVNATVSGSGVAVSGYVAPISNVLAATMDLSAAFPGQVAVRVNGISPVQTIFGIDASVGSFQKYPMFIGSRAGVGLFFNGNLYGLIVNGSLLSAQQITAAERYMNAKTGAY